MGEIINKFINDFTEGITGDPRSGVIGAAQAVTNFDIFKDSRRLFPYNDSESGDGSSSTSQKRRYELGFWTPSPTEWRLFSLGVVSGTGRAEILMKILATGGATDLDDSSWASPANNASSSGSTSFELFVYYHKTGKFYGAKAGTDIWAFTPDGATAFDESDLSVAYTNVAQGLVHSKDDILYVPLDNKIYKNDNGSWTLALTLPNYLYITSICEYGDFLGISCAPLSGVGKSRVFLWNRDSSLTTLSDSIDWGGGVLKWIQEIEGNIVGASQVGGNSTRTRDRIVFRLWAGGGAKRFQEITSVVGQNLTLLSTKQQLDDRVYFMMRVTIDGVIREGVWSVGISKSGRLALSHERTPNNDTALGNGSLIGFFVVGDYMFISYIDNAGSYQVSKTNDQSSFTSTSVYETEVLNEGNSHWVKKLLSAYLTFEPLPAAGQVALYYKKDAETGWTRLFVYNTDNGISKGAVNIESDSTAFTVTIATPAVFTSTGHGLIAGQIIRLRTTGALPTGLTAGQEYYVLSTGLTSSTFRVSLTDGGSAINTTGSQSGTHTIDRTRNLTQGKEFKLRLESTGGAVITGLGYSVEVIDNKVS